MNITILGGGISAVSLAFFLQSNKKVKKIYILEKEKNFGGLLRSYKIKKIFYDVGPHVIFSKHKKILNLMVQLLKENKVKVKRSNKIIFKKSFFIKYPFENELFKLPEKDKNLCLNFFLKNSYKKIKKPKNMKEFFLKLFGKGIFDLYLGPYNNKIWKMDTRLLDTQMVDRIPQPPTQDIINSAKGINTEGYKHQLYFFYPKKGGIESLFKAFVNKLDKKKVSLIKSCKLTSINKLNNNSYEIFFNKTKINSNKIISTIPLNTLYRLFKDKKNLKNYSKKLQYNSIIIAIFNIKGNIGGKNFALMVPDKEIIFHRISRLDFLGKNYSISGTTTLEVEITYRKGDNISQMKDNEIYALIIDGLKKLNFIKNKKDILFNNLNKFKYAYVIYNLNHRKNVDKLIYEYSKLGIYLTGRWGSWEYLNSDQVIYQSKNLSHKILNAEI
jgi:protoporphyrinogen oxidase